MLTCSIIGRAAIGALLMGGACAVAGSTDSDGTIQVPAFSLPQSALLSEESRAAVRSPNSFSGTLKAVFGACPPMKDAKPSQMPGIRKCQADFFYATPFYKDIRKRYSVNLAPQEMGGVYTEVFTPAEGIAERNKQRVLINLHGSGFQVGSRVISHVESVPIAAIGKIQVVAIDYRMAPEYTYPAATEDVAAVYRELLKSYKPGNIGIYGCSAGALLTAQAVAWFEKEHLPMPGAVGMFCEGGSYWTEGDSGVLNAAFYSTQPNPKPEGADKNLYFKGTNLNDPMVFPAHSDGILAKFPPSLLIASTRDLAMSSVVHTHSRLVAKGVVAELHIWEGLDHSFFVDPNIPESREVHDVTVKFFDRYLGTQ